MAERIKQRVRGNLVSYFQSGTTSDNKPLYTMSVEDVDYVGTRTIHDILEIVGVSSLENGQEEIVYYQVMNYKRGDYLTSTTDPNCVVIFDCIEDGEVFSAFCGIDYQGNLQTTLHRDWSKFSDFRPSTDAEKKMLDEHLLQKGLYFNKQKYHLDSIIKRVAYGEKFYYLSRDMRVVDDTEWFSHESNKLYHSGNYFYTEEMAKEYQEEIKKTAQLFWRNKHRKQE